MDAARAGGLLLALANDMNANLANEDVFGGWRSKASAVLRAALGPDSVQEKEFLRATLVHADGYTTGSASQDERRWTQQAIDRGKAILKAAAFALEELTGEGSVDDTAIDPELWQHVQGLIAADDWEKVASAVVIFVEDKVRTWSGDPRHNGGVMVGRDLFGNAMKNDGVLRLGSQASEWEGWRYLGTGLAMAAGNVDRHRIQRRADSKRYAMGVLGLGSLLLTQLRYQHPDRIAETEQDPEPDPA